VPIVPTLIGFVIFCILEILLKACYIKIEKLSITLPYEIHNLLIDRLPVQVFRDPVNLALTNLRVITILCETRGQGKIGVAKTLALIDREGVWEPIVPDEIRVMTREYKLERSIRRMRLGLGMKIVNIVFVRPISVYIMQEYLNVFVTLEFLARMLDLASTVQTPVSRV
jgi:hypothetical protein